MPRKKKRVYSTKPRKTKPKKMPEVPGIDESTTPRDNRMTVDEAVEWFRANPHETEFISLDKMGTAVSFGDRTVEFKGAKLLTSDPVEVEILLRANVPGAKYGTHFVALNPKLRNLK